MTVLPALARAKRRIAHVLTRPEVGAVIRRVFRERVPGCRFITATHAMDDHTVAAIFFGLYEPTERRFVRRYLPRDVDVIELGASLGIVTRTIARHIRPERRVVSVEADSDLCRALRDRVDARRVRVVHGAIDYEGTMATTTFETSGSNLSGRLGTGSTVPRLTLSAIRQAHDLTQFALVCDIEGAEAGIVSDDADALSHCTHVVIETHATTFRGKTLVPDDFRARFEALGFRTVAAHGHVFAFAR